MKWLLAAGVVWFLFLRDKTPLTVGGARAPGLPTTQDTVFRLTLGLNNSGSVVTPDAQLTVQAWPGAYDS